MSDRRKSTRPPTVPIPPELQGRDPDRYDIALRHTFRAQLDPEVARALDQAVKTATEADCAYADFPTGVEAAADDLAALGGWLDRWADNLGDGIERHEIRLANVVLDTVPVILERAAGLRAHARRARREAGEPAASADLPEPPECLPERDRPALRRVFAVQLRPAERETLEGLADNLLELSREGSPAVRAAIAYTSFPDDLRAVALDLRHAERFLRVVGASEGDVLERWEARLADLAAQLAPAVGEIARQLEAAVEAAPAE